MKAIGQKFKKERQENVRYFKSIEAENNDLKGKLEISEIDHDKVICVLMAWSSMKMISGLIQKKM